MLRPGKKRPTNKKNKKQIKKQALLAKFYLVGCIVCRFVFSLYVLFFFFILNKSLFIAVVDFLSRTTILCYYFFMRPADLFFHGRGADECQPFQSLPATISHQIYVLTGAAWSPVPI